MHEYYLRPEVVRVALVLSVLVSVVFYERYQLTTGGAIVPAYLATFLPAPLFILTTLAVAYATYLIVNRAIARRWILYGRRRFEVEILVGLGLVSVTTAVSLALSDVNPLFTGLAGVGLLIPGVLAHDMFRQRPRKTFLAVAITTVVLAVFVYLFSALLSISPVADTETRTDFVDNPGYSHDLLLPGVILSVLMGLVIFDRLGIRSGGFITAAYLALVLPHPVDLVFTAAVGLVTWWVVTRLVMPHVIAFGRRKLSAMLLVGSLLAWTAESVVLTLTHNRVLVWQGFVLMTLMAPALLANDAQRQGVEKTLWGAAIATLAVYGGMNILESGLLAAGWV